MILLPPGQRLPVLADGQRPLHVTTRSGRRDELSAVMIGDLEVVSTVEAAPYWMIGAAR